MPWRRNLGHAEAIRDAAPGRDNAARAAFFQGHLELIGLAPDGTMVTAATIAERDTIAVPAGIATIAALAAAAGLSEAEVRAANPSITTSLPPRVALPGCREHRVVEVSPTSGGHATEGRREIAAQNGVSEADLVRANPGITSWAGLTAGQRILIPRH